MSETPPFQPSLPIQPRSPGATELEARVERLTIIAEALWNLLKEKHGLEEQALLREMVKIDMRDGKLDGRVGSTAPPTPCPKCQRMLNRKSVRCIFCGEPVVTDPFAR